MTIESGYDRVEESQARQFSRLRLLLLVVMTCLPLSVSRPSRAQQPPPARLVVAPTLRFHTAHAAEFDAPKAELRFRRAAPAFPLEWIGGSAGSLLGLGAGLLVLSPSRCHTDDIACILERLGAVGLMSAAGAPLGTVALGNLGGTRPSFVGAAIGSIAGVVAGVVLLEWAEQTDDDALPVPYALVIYGGTHGLVTAIGSRIGALIRGN